MRIVWLGCQLLRSFGATLRSVREINKLTLLIWTRSFALRLYSRAKGAIWLHAASVGEIRAVKVFLSVFREAWPGADRLITGIVSTGSDIALQLSPVEEVRYISYFYQKAAQSFFLLLLFALFDFYGDRASVVSDSRRRKASCSVGYR